MMLKSTRIYKKRGIYGIKVLNVKYMEITYIGIGKSKINERFKEHIGNLKYNSQTMALSRANIKNSLNLSQLK